MNELIIEKRGDKVLVLTRRNPKEDPIYRVWGVPRHNISAGGYLLLNHGLTSYHNMIWISITYTEPFGEVRPFLSVPAARNLRMNHPRSKER